VLLQKTLLNIEGLGRELDPDLDLWATAKPFLENWMSEQIGWRGLLRQLKTELPFWSHALPQLPRLLHRYLEEAGNERLSGALQRLADETRDQNIVLALIAVALLSLSGLLLYIAY
jgi:ubiquinone biosynthesis protein